MGVLSVAFQPDPVGLVLRGGFSVLLSRLVPSSVIGNGGPIRDHRSVSRGDRVPPTLTDVAPGQGPVCSADRTKDYHRSEGGVRRDVEKLGVTSDGGNLVRIVVDLGRVVRCLAHCVVLGVVLVLEGSNSSRGRASIAVWLALGQRTPLLGASGSAQRDE